MCFSPNRLTKKTPTLYLPCTYPGATSYTRPTPRLPQRKTRRPEAEGSKEEKQKEKRERRKMRKKKSKWKNTYPRAELRRPKARPSQKPESFAFPSPLRRPSRGRSVTLGKSRRRTAYPQQIVTTRLLYCLQDRFAQLSRLQRI